MRSSFVISPQIWLWKVKQEFLFTDVLSVFQKIVSHLALCTELKTTTKKQKTVHKSSSFLNPKSWPWVTSTTIWCQTYPICPISLWQQLPTRCRHRLLQTICLSSFSWHMTLCQKHLSWKQKQNVENFFFEIVLNMCLDEWVFSTHNFSNQTSGGFNI